MTSIFSRLVGFAALFLFFAAPAPSAHAFAVTGNLPLQVEPVGSTWDTVVADAKAQSTGAAAGGTPIYHSTQLEETTFIGDFTADSDTTNLAIFSDDGCDVFIDGSKVWGDRDKGHALENLPASLHVLPLKLTPGQTYHIEIDYSNVYYLGDGDIDGVTLFAYKDAPAVTLTSSASALCAGGWSGATAPDGQPFGYRYLQKETSAVVSRSKPDPHIATMTATVTDVGGNALSGQTVTFTWSMPAVDVNGNEAPLLESHTATTDSNGVASVDVTSGNEVASGVSITAACLGVSSSTDLDVQAADAAWFYQDTNGAYQPWDGTMEGLTAHTNDPIPLAVLLSFQGVPVIGHPMNWSMSQVLDKDANNILPEASGPYAGYYFGYGQMSGPISTTNVTGYAQAAYVFGFKQGQITYQIDDSNVYDSLASPSTSKPSAIAPNAVRGMGSPLAVVRRGRLHYQKVAAQHGEHTYVANTTPAPPIGISDTSLNSKQFRYSYPAPGGEEDEEIIDETWDCITKAMYAKYGLSYPNGNQGHEWTVYDLPNSLPGLNSTMNEQIYFGRTQSDHLEGDWWISQGVGDDPTSFGTHLEDMRWNTHLYSAAFDIVLSNTTIYTQYIPTGPLSQFGSYVGSLRDQGIVCWHRWAGEPGGFTENEIHCIDPAFPLIKAKLQNQIVSFIHEDTNHLPQYDFTINDNQVIAVKTRYLTVRANLQATPYSNAQAINGVATTIQP